MKTCNPKNERVKRDYWVHLKHAEGKADQSIEKIEKAILRFEEFTGFADFATFNQRIAVAFKDHLAMQDLAKPTILATVTKLKRFFGWLSMQSGYKNKIRLPDIEFLSLSNKDVRAAKAPTERPYPSLEQIKKVLQTMPVRTPIERRDRALVAFTILTGIRDGAIITIRVKHVDVSRRLVVQHPQEVATKGAKRIDAFFLPLGDEIEEIVVEWVRYLRDELLFGDNDPLFPKCVQSHDENKCFVATELSKDFWSGAGQVRAIFKAAFESVGLPQFTPHSFRKTIVSEMYRRRLSVAECKAWSQNLGHESAMTTLTSYGKLSLQEQGRLVRDARTGTDTSRPATVADLERLMERLKG